MNAFITTCDACGKEKGKSNHWIVLHRNTYGCLRVMSWEHADMEGAIHLCGESCTIKKVSEFLGSLLTTV